MTELGGDTTTMSTEDTAAAAAAPGAVATGCFQGVGRKSGAGLRDCGTAPMALVQISPAVPHQGPHTVPQCTKTTTYRRAIDASCGPAT